MSLAKARLEARIDPELEALIDSAARTLRISKTAFVTQALREAAMRVTARSDVILMDPRQFDSMLSSLDVADSSPELKRLAELPRNISE